MAMEQLTTHLVDSIIITEHMWKKDGNVDYWAVGLQITDADGKSLLITAYNNTQNRIYIKHNADVEHTI